MREPPHGQHDLYLGFDLSTQSCKGLLLEATGRVVLVEKIVFDTDLPHYGTRDGVHRDGAKVTSPPAMWAEAMELCIRRLAANVDLSTVVAISGSGQQHGTVYWTPEGVERLRSFSSDGLAESQERLSIAALLKGAFLRDSPVWMDTSCIASCKEMEEAVGGPLELARRTGSAAYERYSAHLIRQTFEREPWDACASIGLVSTFGASLLRGDALPLDWCDGAGCNLMDIRTKQWDDELMEFAGGQPLRRLLPTPVPPWSELGAPSPFWQRLGLPATARLVAWSGDNPCAIVGLGLLAQGDVAISLGTSDTCLSVLPLPREPVTFGHLFPHPTLPDLYMSMLCYTNGDVTRRRVRDDYAGGSWETFSASLATTPAGNDGCLGYYLTVDEVQPPLAQGDAVIWRRGAPCSDLSPEQHIRGVIEMRALAMRSHLARLSPELLARSGRLLLTGGASINPAIRQVFADIFQRPVMVLDCAEAAALGAAIRAMHGVGVELPKNVGAGEEAEQPEISAADVEEATKQFESLEAFMLDSRGR